VNFGQRSKANIATSSPSKHFALSARAPHRDTPGRSGVLIDNMPDSEPEVSINDITEYKRTTVTPQESGTIHTQNIELGPHWHTLSTTSNKTTSTNTTLLRTTEHDTTTSSTSTITDNPIDNQPAIAIIFRPIELITGERREPDHQIQVTTSAPINLTLPIPPSSIITAAINRTLLLSPSNH
jgi:hypothetical protein